MPTKTRTNPKKKPPEQPASTPEGAPEPQVLPDTATIELADNAPSSVLERRVKLTDTSMVIAQETTFEEACSLYDFTHTIRERGRWWLGDIVNFMEDHFPEKYTQAIDLTGLSYSRLTTICSVCRRIEPSRRRKEASFSWHEKVAYLPYQNADHLLDRGIKEKWTNEQFEDSVAKAKGEPTKAEKRASKAGSTAAKVAASGKEPQVPEGEKPPLWDARPLRVMNVSSQRVILAGDEPLEATEADKAAESLGHAHGPALAAWLEEHNFRKEETPCATKTPDSEQTAPVPGKEPATAPTAPSTVASNGASVVQPDAAPKSGIIVTKTGGPSIQPNLDPNSGQPAAQETASTASTPVVAPPEPKAEPTPPATAQSPIDIAEAAILQFNAVADKVDWKAIGASALNRKKWLANLLKPADDAIDAISSTPPPK